jgi:hypothetical protein
MKAIYLIAGTAFLLAIGTALVETNDTCCGGEECAPTCCVEDQDCCDLGCAPNCCQW